MFSLSSLVSFSLNSRKIFFSVSSEEIDVLDGVKSSNSLLVSLFGSVVNVEGMMEVGIVVVLETGIWQTVVVVEESVSSNF